MNDRIKALLGALTLAEKASLCSGFGNWDTKSIPHLDIPALYMTDGPHGLRKEAGDGFGNSIPATCFPTASALSASWNPALLHEIGQAIGRECQAQDVDIILGPGINIKRHPLNGRNFEYFSEDPYLSGKLAASFVRGIQSEGVGTSVKHYAVNNQEFERMTISAEVDERTLREIYLAGFEIVVKEAQPWTIMAAYNQVNGTFASEDKGLLTDILMKEWTFEGLAVSDWSAVQDRVAGIRAGLHLEMPGNQGINDRKIVAAVEAGELDEGALDQIVARILAVTFRAEASRKPDSTADLKAHHTLARQMAGECIVLLKNEASILPLQAEKTPTVAIIGQFAKQTRFQGGGSSLLNPTQVSQAWDELLALGEDAFDFSYAPGYDESHEQDPTLIQEAVEAAQAAACAVLFVGLPDDFESEGIDRTHLDIPSSHQALIEAVAAVQPQTVVVLYNGAPITMPWLDRVQAVVEGWLGGQAIGGAIADVLLGKVNPSGKLGETFPQALQDTPAYLNWPGYGGKVQYGEGVFVGYRYYHTKGVKPLFPFGFGLSYTSFDLSNMSLSATSIKDTDELHVSITLTNTGQVAGKEVVQLYVRDVASSIIRPERELRAFEKVELLPGASKEVVLTLDARAFSFYDVKSKGWIVENGQFEILVGTSSEHIAAIETVDVSNATPIKLALTPNSLLKDYLKHPDCGTEVQGIVDGFVNQMTSTIPATEVSRRKQVSQFFTYIIHDLPLYKLPQLTLGEVSEEQVEKILEMVE